MSKVRLSGSHAREPVVVNQTEGAAARAILARNIFDAKTGPLWPPPQVEEPTPPPSPEPQASNAYCAIDVRVTAAFFDRREPARSWVVLRGPLIGSSPRTYTRGMPVGELFVEHIQPEAVRLADRTGRGCWLAMFTPQSSAQIALERAADTPRKRRARKGRKPDPPFSPQELQAGVRPLGGNRYTIRRHVIEKARVNAADIARSTRVVPARGKHRGSGLRLARIRKRGLLAHLGLHRGDILRSVNGIVTSDVGTLLGAYAKLDRTNRIELAVTRGRESLLLKYYVQ